MPSLYQRVIHSGIPYWKDAAGNLYYYEGSALPTEETRILLGTEAAGLNPDWAERLQAKQIAYRAASKPRARATPAAKN